MIEKNDDFWFVYFGTKGISGLYTHRINEALRSAGIRYKSFVSYGYPFEDSVRIFFPYSDIYNINNVLVRKVIRFVELILAYAYIVILVIVQRPKCINISVISGTYIEVIFIYSLRAFSNVKILITTHDVVPFAENEEGESKIRDIMEKAYSSADYLLCHNEFSTNILINEFFIRPEKILIHKFPLMDCSIIYDTGIAEKIFDFAFIGHLRKNKGLDILFDAWKEFSNSVPNASIYIGGKPSTTIIENAYEVPSGPGVTVKLGYLSDEELFNVLNSARNIILPYRYGTNSGILSHGLAAGCNIIYSKIDSFSALDYLDMSGAFYPVNAKGLEEKLREFYDGGLFVFDAFDYNRQFDKEVAEVYSYLLTATMNF
jgi:glycosyltransferase involved in cell wall biosynthesis